ncbi:MAG: threonyl-tRNA synthetase editing domain-containing protein [Candidatus Binatia bacterium]
MQKAQDNVAGTNRSRYSFAMRFLILHVNSFCCTITEKGRAKVYESFTDPVTRVDEALVVLSSVEKGDEQHPVLVAQRASAEIHKFATQLKVSTIVVHPFAHLFANLGVPEVAIEILQLTQHELQTLGHRCIRTPFGWFNSLQIDAKGHPLSRVARIVTVEEENGTTKTKT